MRKLALFSRDDLSGWESDVCTDAPRCRQLAAAGWKLTIFSENLKALEKLNDLLSLQSKRRTSAMSGNEEERNKERITQFCFYSDSDFSSQHPPTQHPTGECLCNKYFLLFLFCTSLICLQSFAMMFFIDLSSSLSFSRNSEKFFGGNHHFPAHVAAQTIENLINANRALLQSKEQQWNKKSDEDFSSILSPSQQWHKALEQLLVALHAASSNFHILIHRWRSLRWNAICSVARNSSRAKVWSRKNVSVVFFLLLLLSSYMSYITRVSMICCDGGGSAGVWGRGKVCFCWDNESQ